MATYTAQALIAAGLRKADQVDSPTAFIAHPTTSPGEAFELLNAALSELWETIYEADSAAYARVNNPFNTVAGTSDYAITTVFGTAFYHLTAVEYFDGTRWIGLDRVNFADRNNYWQNGRPQGYALSGTNLTLYPASDAVYQVRAWSVPLPPVVTTGDTDTFDLQGPWYEFVWKHFAKSCQDKEESDSSNLTQDLYGSPFNPGGLAGRIRAASKKRDNGKPALPVDVQGDSDPILGGGLPYYGRIF